MDPSFSGVGKSVLARSCAMSASRSSSPMDLDLRLPSRDAWCIAISRLTCAAVMAASASRCLASKTSGTSAFRDIVEARAIGEASSCDCIADLMRPVKALMSKLLSMVSAVLQHSFLSHYVLGEFRDVLNLKC